MFFVSYKQRKLPNEKRQLRIWLAYIALNN